MRLIEPELFLLIKSLTKREKSNFVRYCRKSGKSENYLPLFKLIEKQKEYNEGKIRAFFKGKTFLKNFSQTKKNLSIAIIRSLRQVGYSTNESIYIQFEDTLQYFNRGILLSASRHVKKLKTRVKTIEDFHLWEKCIELERRIAFKSMAVKEYLKEVDSLNQEQGHLTIMKNSFERVRRINDLSLDPFKKKVRARGLGDLDAVQELSGELNRIETGFVSIRAEREHLTFAANLAAFQRDGKEAYLQNQKLDQLYTINPFLIEDYFEDFVDRKAKLAALEFSFGQKERALQTLDSIKNLKTDFPFHHIFLKDRVLLLSLFFEENDIGKFLSDSEIYDIGEFAKNNPVDPLRRIKFYYWLAVIYLKRGDFQNSTKWSGRIIQNEWGEILIDFQCMARIIHLLSIFAIGDSELLEVFHRSSLRFLKKRKSLFLYEKVVIRFLKKEMGRFPEKLIELKETIIKKVSKDDLNNIAHFFDLEAWIDSLEKKTFKH